MKNRIFRPWKIEYSDRDNIDWYFDHENIDENFDHENIDEIIDHENIRSWNISIMKFLILDVYDRDMLGISTGIPIFFVIFHCDLT